MSEKTIELSNEFLEYPEVVEIAPQATVIDTITQEGYLVPNLMTKINLLDYFLRKSDFEKVLIFTKTKTSANDIYKFIGRKITDSVRVIHGNKDQNTRINAINDFTTVRMRSAARKGSAAVPTTSISGSELRMAHRVCRTRAESSITSTLILFIV
jgi:ATP-dependent RNA helicase RhlE